MNLNDVQIRLSEEQKQKLHELHLIQQRELYNMIRRHQQEQLQIFEQLQEKEQIQHNLSKSLFSKEIKQSNLNYSRFGNFTQNFYQMLFAYKKLGQRPLRIYPLIHEPNLNVIQNKIQIQYKLLRLQPILKNPGQGLGPTLSIEKWEQSKDKMDRMLEFAEHVKLEHRNFKRRIQKCQQKQVTARQRGLEFARSVLKPILIHQPQKLSRLQHVQENNELLEYELRNQILKQQIEKIK